MASCPKCGKTKIRKNRKLGYRVCRHCGPISHNAIVAQLRANGLMAPAVCEEVTDSLAQGLGGAPFIVASPQPRLRVTWKSK